MFVCLWQVKNTYFANVEGVPGLSATPYRRVDPATLSQNIKEEEKTFKTKVEPRSEEDEEEDEEELQNDEGKESLILHSQSEEGSETPTISTIISMSPAQEGNCTKSYYIFKDYKGFNNKFVPSLPDNYALTSNSFPTIPKCIMIPPHNIIGIRRL